MTNKQIVSKLRELGHEVEVYIRKDGSIRVTSIDGVKYSHRLSTGVQAARDLYFNEGGLLAGEEVARYEAVKRQRAAARVSVKTGATLKSQSAEFQAAYKRFQAEVRRINKKLAKEGKKPKFSVTWETTRRGAAKANISIEKQLKRAQDYFAATSQGIAPAQLVEEFITKFNMWSKAFPELKSFLDFAKANKKRLDIYETKATIEWGYGYIQGQPQSDTLEERLYKFTTSVHAR